VDDCSAIRAVFVVGRVNTCDVFAGDHSTFSHEKKGKAALTLKRIRSRHVFRVPRGRMEGIGFFLGLFVDFYVPCPVVNTPARAEDIVPTASLDDTTDDRCD
jgi:hypothetical protein